jgi:hypothetical protein
MQPIEIVRPGGSQQKAFGAELHGSA